ncbi:hypothetical protein BGW36DRAFT_286079 [Talaromyces proteolyticus]|uniref:Uncharacterized protein n=1 Tax=Talaromyces proteolyticus TaxID=1131652 RepID=A0AAD4Q0V5_9EURO|nr:uncharacterized protein BGW36DRAFT_286079 [Talaromyces proteolyticus]KAH8704920.1 hypothetical protein BGW36DRAFT_286079 [Talaromyces proteolyticus]
MDQFASPSGPNPLGSRPGPTPKHVLKLGRLTKIGVPVIAVVGLGYGVSTFLEAQRRVQQQTLQEEERLRKNAQLLDAYGDKSSLEDMQRALEHYHKVRRPRSTRKPPY